MIAVTGATGQLGQLVVQGLLRTQPAAQVAHCSAASPTSKA